MESHCGGGLGGCRLQAADLAVSEAVVDERDDLAGCRDFGDGSAVAAFGECFSLGVKPGVFAEFLGGFDRGPAHEPVALFGDRAPGDLDVGLAVAWGEATPRREMPGRSEPVDVARSQRP